jgi:hypothetical protein
MSLPAGEDAGPMRSVSQGNALLTGRRAEAPPGIAAAECRAPADESVAF